MEKDKDSAFPYSIPKINAGFCRGLTKKEYAAIMLLVPESGTDWLDDMITKARMINN